MKISDYVAVLTIRQAMSENGHGSYSDVAMSDIDDILLADVTIGHISQKQADKIAGDCAAILSDYNNKARRNG